MKELNHLSEIFDSYDTFLIDLWGVMHNGIMLNSKAIDVIHNLKNKSKKIVFLSNAPRPSSKVKNFLLKMNMDDLKNVTIQEKVLNYHSHFDILDKPWANQINKFSFQEKTKENRAYADEVLPIINEFYNN